MDSFYIVLPSNTAFLGNKTSDYIVKLPNIIDLSDGNWSVALSSIVYPLSFSGIEESQTITIIYSDNSTLVIDIPQRLQYSSIKQFTNVLNDTIHQAIFDKKKLQGKTREKRSPKLDQRPKGQQRERPIQSNTETQLAQRPKGQQREQPIQSSAETQIAQRPKGQQREKPIQSNETQIAQRPKEQQREQPIQSNTEAQIAQRPKGQHREQPTESDFDQTPTRPLSEQPVINHKPREKAETQKSQLREQADQKLEQRSTQPARIDVSPQPQNEISSKIPTPPTTEPQLTIIDPVLVKEKPALGAAKKDESNIKTPKLSETDLQSLETAKRVTGNFYEEIDKTFDKIESYNSICQEILKRVQNTPGVEAGSEADKLKTNIGSQTISLLTLRDSVLIERNKAKEFKEKVEANFSNQNLRSAKANTDSVKKIKKSIMGDEKSNGYLHRIEAIRNQVDDDSEAFFDMIEDRSLDIERVYNETIVIRDILRNGYQQILVYEKDIQEIMEDLRAAPSDEANKAIYNAEKIIALRVHAKLEFAKLDSLIKEMDQFYVDKKLSGMHKKLIEIKMLSKILQGEGHSIGYFQTIKSLRDMVFEAYTKIKAIKPITEVVDDPRDTWHESEDIKTHQRVYGEESITEGHVPKAIPLQEKDDSEKSDEWNIIDKWTEESKQFDYRKNEIVNKIKTYFGELVKIPGTKDIKNPEYQQIYFTYDEDQLQRFFIWVNDHKNIKSVRLSKQLSYMLGFVEDHEGFVIKNSFARYNPDISGGIHSFYIYAPNLVANTIIGNQYGPLLRVINVDLESKNKVVETIYTQEFHHKVLLKQIPEIQIQILSDTSRPIEFNWGNCIITLHFRRSIF
jgi:hypothetical protein